jgi:F-type H+-transporting ATPase subunit a
MITIDLVSLAAKKLSLPVEINEGNLHIATSLIICVFLFIASLLAWRRLRKTDNNIIPSAKFSFATVFEIVVEAVLHLMEDIIGPRARRYFPLIGSIFIYVLVCDLIGVIPGFSPPTGNINTNFACAICVFLYYNYVGIREQGLIKYIKHMAGPVFWLAPLMLTIELVSHLVRPISLSVRLFGNMVGDHMVLSIFSNLVPFVVPAVFMALTIFVAFIQAFVFSLLSIVYIALATEKEGH